MNAGGGPAGASVGSTSRPPFLARFRQRRPGTGLIHLCFYEFIRTLTLAVFTVVYRIRSFGLARLPRTGPILLVANHQSFLDPPSIGASVHTRQLDYLARG